MAVEYNLGRVVGQGMPPGGEEGQMLIKNSSQNFDARWGIAGARTLSHTLPANWPGGQQTIPIPGLTATTPGILYISTLAPNQAAAAWVAARPVLTQAEGVLTVAVSVAPTVDIPIVIRLDSGEGSIRLDSDLPIMLLGQAGGFAGLDKVYGVLPFSQLAQVGPWSPYLYSGYDGTNITYTANLVGTYTKIGELVIAVCDCVGAMAITNVGATGGNTPSIGGLPFVCKTHLFMGYSNLGGLNVFIDRTAGSILDGGAVLNYIRLSGFGAQGKWKIATYASGWGITVMYIMEA